MATLVLTNGQHLTITPEKAREVWAILRGTVEPTPEQEAFCLKIADILFNWRNAPDDYIQQHLEAIIPLALNDWSVNRQGKFTRLATEDAWQFAKRWGLWSNGQPTHLVPNQASPYVQKSVDFSEPSHGP